ncbi:hypothetical protein HCJ94_28950, partial [Micromonospora sp. HSS6-12]|nr:hypothetical protein [Micromonospora thermarum]
QRTRAEDKVRKYGGDVSRLTDLAAAKVVFAKLSDLYRAVRLVTEDPDVEIVEVEDRFAKPQASGYRDIQMMLRMSNGHIAEFRLHLAALDVVDGWEHSLYEVRRDLESIARERGNDLSLMERAIYNGLLTREQSFFWDALKSTLGEGRPSAGDAGPGSAGVL